LVSFVHRGKLSSTAKFNKIVNTKQTVPLIATLAPLALPVAIVCGIFFALKWVLTDEDKEKKPGAAPADTSIKPVTIPVSSAPRVVVPPPTIPNAPQIPSPALVSAIAPHPKSITQASPPPPIKKSGVTREDVATVFHRGARPLTRTAAVAALRSLGFGRTAAYEALSPDGRFASRLQVAPDGTITWAD
jgi:hypothetical protein